MVLVPKAGFEAPNGVVEVPKPEPGEGEVSNDSILSLSGNELSSSDSVFVVTIIDGPVGTVHASLWSEIFKMHYASCFGSDAQ